MKKVPIPRGVLPGCAAVTFCLSLFTSPTVWGSLSGSAAVLVMALALCRSKVADPVSGGCLWPALWAALSAAVFTHRTLDTLRVMDNVPPGWVMIAVGAVGAAASLVFFYHGFGLLAETEVPTAEPGEKDGSGTTVFLLLTAAAVITVCSKSSPLYPFNDWADSNCYLTVGRAMLRGRVLYRDIYEQKGILLYALHAAAACVSGRSFLGMWLWEIAAAWMFLLFSYKMLRLFAPRRILTAMPVLAAVVYTLPCFVFGDLAEEFCLPLLAWALYAGFRAMREDRPLTRREWLLVGVTSGCVFWIKYSMVAFYLGWVLVPIGDALRRRDGRALGQMAGFVALGVALVTAPVLAYFGVHRALGDLWTGYFYNNIFLYHRGGEHSIFYLTLENLKNSFQGAAPMYVSFLFTLPWLLGRQDRRMGIQTLLSMAALCLGIFNADHLHIYYAFILAVYVPLGALPCLTLWDKARLPREKGWIRAAALGSAALILGTCCENLYMLPYKKEDLPQYRFAAIVESYDDPTLLNYRFLDGGFYTAAGVIPTEKYFCALNLSLPEIKEEQDRCVAEGRTDFVVTMDRKKTSEHYVCVAEQTFPPGEEGHTYRLFIRKDLLNPAE